MESTKNYSNIDKQTIYSQCRSAFKGANSTVRKRNSILNIVQNHQTLKPLLKTFGEEKVLDILESLLANKVFQEESVARARFPTLFTTQFPVAAPMATPVAAPVVVTPKKKADTILKIHEEKQEASGLGTNKTPVAEPVTKHIPTSNEGQSRAPRANPEATPNQTDKPHDALPYKIQHEILNRIQKDLEAACWEFAVTWLPSTLEENSFTCPEAIELNIWHFYLQGVKFDKLPASAVDLGDGTQPFSDILEAVKPLRHTAVHRNPISMSRLADFVSAAARLAGALRDRPREAQLRMLECELWSRIETLDKTRKALEEEERREMQQIAELREGLVRRERAVKERIVRESKNGVEIAGCLVEQRFRVIFDGAREGCEEQEEEGKEKPGWIGRSMEVLKGIW